MHHFKISGVDGDTMVTFDGIEVTGHCVNGININVSFYEYFNRINLVRSKIDVLYIVKCGDCEFQLNDDLTINGKCHGAVCCSTIDVPTRDLFTSEITPSQEIIKNFSSESMLFILYEKYDNDIFMHVLYININSNYTQSNDKFGHIKMYESRSGLMHVFIKYDHGQLDHSITPARPSQQHTKPAPRDAVIDDASE
jgi:hypothetical protein